MFILEATNTQIIPSALSKKYLKKKDKSIFFSFFIENSSEIFYNKITKKKKKD
jgi:hypothetical protein